MPDHDLPDDDSSTSDAAQRSLVDDVRALVEDGRTLVEAEYAYQKSRAVVAGTGARGVLAWGALGVALVFFALMALVIGAVIGLIGKIGPWGAAGVVASALLVLAALCLLVASRRWSRTARLLSDQGSGE